MSHLEIRGQGPQAPVTCKPECWVIVEYIPIEMNTDISSHILGAVTEHFFLFHPLVVHPLGDNVVGHLLHQAAGDLIQLHELLHTIQSLVVLGSGQGHVVDDGGDMSEYCSVEQAGDGHHHQGENLLIVGVRSNIAKPNGGHAGHGEVKSSDIHVASIWASSYFSSIFC